MVQNYEQYIKKVGKLNRNSEVLSASIISNLNQVFYADDLSSPCVNARDLSVRYVTQEQFHKMVTGDPSVSAWFEPTTLYVVSSDEINAYNTNIKNVADPLEPKDAANKRYVDAISSALSGQIGGLDVSNSLEAGKILTSLTQSDGKISYSAKTLEISDVNNLKVNLDGSSNKLSTLENDLWSALSSIADYDAPSAMSFNEAISTVFLIAKALKETRLES